MSTHHLAKLESQTAGGRKPMNPALPTVSARIGDRIPTVLALPEQSLFALGYYQMSAAMHEERRERYAKQRRFCQ